MEAINVIEFGILFGLGWAIGSIGFNLTCDTISHIIKKVKGV